MYAYIYIHIYTERPIDSERIKHGLLIIQTSASSRKLFFCVSCQTEHSAGAQADRHQRIARKENTNPRGTNKCSELTKQDLFETQTRHSSRKLVSCQTEHSAGAQAGRHQQEERQKHRGTNK